MYVELSKIFQSKSETYSTSCDCYVKNTENFISVKSFKNVYCSFLCDGYLEMEKLY